MWERREERRGIMGRGMKKKIRSGACVCKEKERRGQKRHYV